MMLNYLHGKVSIKGMRLNVNMFLGIISSPGKFFKSSSCRLAHEYFQHIGRADYLSPILRNCLHFPGLKDIDKPLVWVFPEVLVCLDCGVAVFAVPETELGALAILRKAEAEQRKESPLGSSKPHS